MNRVFILIGSCLSVVGCTSEPGRLNGNSVTSVVSSTEVSESDVLNAEFNSQPPFQVHPLTPQFGYFNGKIMPHPRVVEVLYGIPGAANSHLYPYPGTNTYIGQIANQAGRSMASFYQQFLNTGVLDQVCVDYSRPSYSIGRGGLSNVYMITPSHYGTPCNHIYQCLSDTDIGAELTSQISSGYLPPPDASIIYAVHFPEYIGLVDSPTGRVFDCNGGGAVCSRHWTTKTASGQEVYFASLPDLTLGTCPSTCGVSSASTCGDSTTDFENATTAASHEIAETITDPEVAYAGTNSSPINGFGGWAKTQTGGFQEIGDVCNPYTNGTTNQQSFVGWDNNCYASQTLFSNAQNKCYSFSATSITPNMSDILWRSTTDGAEVIWFMNGGTPGQQPRIGNPGSGWVIQGVGDFDGDGHSDILWRGYGSGYCGNNQSTCTAIWFMNGGTIVSQAYPQDPGSNYQVLGVGDFDGDGMADVLWRWNYSAVLVWLMNGGAPKSPQPTFNDPGSAWAYQGLGDFDGDGRKDILWRNTTAGSLNIWFMTGANPSNQPPLAFSIPDPGSPWQIQGFGDFDGDGKSDILWRKQTYDGLAIWFMNCGPSTSATPWTGTSCVDTPVPAAYPSDPGYAHPSDPWTIQRVGDFDGDGRADILWRTTSQTGTLAIWFMHAGSHQNDQYPFDPGSGYLIWGLGNFD